MLLIVRILYIALIGFIVFRMFKGGGCCGGHHGHHKGSTPAADKHVHKPTELITEDEKKKAIDIS